MEKHIRHDFDAITVAFKAMRKAGLLARQNYLCCGSCAGSAIGTYFGKVGDKKRAKILGACTYHHQAHDRAKNGGKLILNYGKIENWAMGGVQHSTSLETEEVGKIVCQCLEDAGLAYEWDGNGSSCIFILGTKKDILRDSLAA